MVGFKHFLSFTGSNCVAAYFLITLGATDNYSGIFRSYRNLGLLSLEGPQRQRIEVPLVRDCIILPDSVSGKHGWLTGMCPVGLQKGSLDDMWYCRENQDLK